MFWCKRQAAQAECRNEFDNIIMRRSKIQSWSIRELRLWEEIIGEIVAMDFETETKVRKSRAGSSSSNLESGGCDWLGGGVRFN